MALLVNTVILMYTALTDPGLCLTANSDGTVILAPAESGDKTQQWAVTQVSSDGIIQLTNQASGNLLAATQKQPGAAVAATSNDATNVLSLWKEVPGPSPDLVLVQNGPVEGLVLSVIPGADPSALISAVLQENPQDQALALRSCWQPSQA